LLLLTVVGAQLWGQWGQLQSRTLSFDWKWGLLALAGILTFFSISAEGWRRRLGGLGVKLAYRDCFRIIFYSNLGKYLPGGIWNMVGRVTLAQRLGVTPLMGTASLLMEVACQLAAALIIALVTLPLWAGSGLQADARLLAAAVLLVPVLMHPRVLNFGIGVGEKLIRRSLPRLPFSYGFVLAMLLLYTCNWGIFSLGFAALAQAISPTTLTLAQVGLLIGAFPIAWNVAVFAFIFPAGLGVREVALAALLGTAFPPGWPALLALVARLWSLGGEVVAFGVASWLSRSEPPTTR
jgi:hypothetical protein